MVSLLRSTVFPFGFFHKLLQLVPPRTLPFVALRKQGYFDQNVLSQQLLKREDRRFNLGQRLAKIKILHLYIDRDEFIADGTGDQRLCMDIQMQHQIVGSEVSLPPHSHIFLKNKIGLMDMQKSRLNQLIDGLLSAIMQLIDINTKPFIHAFPCKKP